MVDELNVAIRKYQEKWQQLVAARKNKAFFEKLKPTAVCWKTEDLEDLDRRSHEIRDHCDHLHLGWINERWLATAHSSGQKLRWDIQIVKIYQRRPGSTDATGLDHVDFYAPDIDEDVLADEPNLKWTHESNNEFSSWISLWFAGTEAKLRTNTTIDVCVAELKAVNQKVLGLV